MNISFFLIAVISSVAIAKPLLDFQTNTPFGYFPSSFGAAGQLYTPLNSQAKKPLLSHSAHPTILSTDATDSWGSPVMQAPGNDNTFPDSSNPAQMNLASSNVPDNSDPSPISNGPDNSNPTPISNGPAEKDPTSSHATTDHPPGTSPAFRQFREFWCGTHEGRDQSICCMGNKYGTFRPFSGELTCEKSMSFLSARPLFHNLSAIIT